MADLLDRVERACITIDEGREAARRIRDLEAENARLRKRLRCEIADNDPDEADGAGLVVCPDCDCSVGSARDSVEAAEFYLDHRRERHEREAP